MTNREYIESLTNEEIADFISERISDCDDCPIKNYCEKDLDLTGLCNHSENALVCQECIEFDCDWFRTDIF